MSRNPAQEHLPRAAHLVRTAVGSDRSRSVAAGRVGLSKLCYPGTNCPWGFSSLKAVHSSPGNLFPLFPIYLLPALKLYRTSLMSFFFLSVGVISPYACFHLAVCSASSLQRVSFLSIATLAFNKQTVWLQSLKCPCCRVF